MTGEYSSPAAAAAAAVTREEEEEEPAADSGISGESYTLLLFHSAGHIFWAIVVAAVGGRGGKSCDLSGDAKFLTKVFYKRWSFRKKS